MLAASLSGLVVDQNLIFTAVFVLAVGLVAVVAGYLGWSLLGWLRAEAVVVAAAIVYLTGVVFYPLLFERQPARQVKLEQPAYDYGPWHAWPVQVEGRTKPFETAAREALRQITGHEKFEGQDPVTIVLQWILDPD